MKVLMFLRDPLPPARADVKVLFDKALRLHGVRTDFVGTALPESTVIADPDSSGHLFLAPRVRGWRILQLAASVVNDIRVSLRLARSYDVVIVRDRPIEGVFLFAWARLVGSRTAYWMSFPIPLGDRISGERQMRSGQFVRGLAVLVRGLVGGWLERRVTLALADQIFAQSDAMVQAIAVNARLRAKCTAVPMGVDLAAIESISASSVSEGLALDRDARWIIYLGSLDRTRQLDRVVDALALLPHALGDVRLALVGGANDAADTRWLEEHIKSRGLGSRVRIIGPLPMREAWALAASADCGVSPIPPGPLFDVSSPTKLVEYLALGLPAVATRIPDQEKVLRESGAGLCVEFSATELARAIALVLGDPSGWRDLARNGRAYIADHRSYSALSELVAQRLLGLRVRPQSPPGEKSGQATG